MRLYWHDRRRPGADGWVPTTAPATDAERVRLEMMGYATRVCASVPVDGPSDEERARVNAWTPGLL